MNSIASAIVSSASQTMKINTTASVFSASQTDTTVSTSTTEATILTQWGFKVDENGYFGADFNATAGIPSNVKINEKTLETVANSLQAIGSSQDPISGLSKAWNNFTKIAGNSLDPDGSMSLSQIHSMPVSYETDSSIFGNIVGVQQTQDQFLKSEEVMNVIGSLSNGALDTGTTTFLGIGRTYIDESTGENIDQLSYYKELLNEIGITTDEGNANDDEISVGNLFSYFIEEDAPSGSQDRVEAIQAYYAFIQSGQSIEEYSKSTFGEDFFSEALSGYGTMPDGLYSSALVDQLLKEVDNQMVKDREVYKSIVNATQFFALTSATTQQYLTLNDSTLLSGSLISVET